MTEELDKPMVFQAEAGKVIDCGPIEDINFDTWHVDFEELNYFIAVPRLDAYDG
jgi:hypothetical protein